MQVSYAIVSKPCGLFVNTYGALDLPDGEIALKLKDIFDLRPYAIEQRLKLRNPIYSETAAYGHMGRKMGSRMEEFRGRTAAPGK